MLQPADSALLRRLGGDGLDLRFLRLARFLVLPHLTLGHRPSPRLISLSYTMRHVIQARRCTESTPGPRPKPPKPTPPTPRARARVEPSTLATFGGRSAAAGPRSVEQAGRSAA